MSTADNSGKPVPGPSLPPESPKEAADDGTRGKNPESDKELPRDPDKRSVTADQESNFGR